jgi:alcohol dehydrogenase
MTTTPPTQRIPTMRALIFDGTSATLTTSHPAPSLEPDTSGDAVVRTLRAAITSLDLQVTRGLLEFTGVLGHEFVGLVESIAGGDSIGLTGKRVVGSATTFCGRCDMCQAGLSAHCRDRTMLGIHGRDGCLAERFAIPARNLVAVPDSVDDDHAIFAESLASAIQAVRQLTIEGKPYITVLGDGPLGLLMVQLMSRLNASVRLVGRSSENLALCEKWGVKHRHVDDIGRRADQDVVVECTGAAAGLEVAARLVRPRGKILLKSLLAPESRIPTGIDLTSIVLKEIELIGSHRGPISESVSMLARNEVDVVSLIGCRMSLDDGTALLDAVAKPGALKVLVSV